MRAAAGATEERLAQALAREAPGRGWRHTLSEIFQQPELWQHTAERCATRLRSLPPQVRRAAPVVLTGSGSSHYVGVCIAPAIQRRTGRQARAMASGELILARPDLLPPQRPLSLVSFSRSGSSPETLALISACLQHEPSVEHRVITCNPKGHVVRRWPPGSAPRVAIDVLDPRSCDKSLMMTSSFTNLALAGLSMAYVKSADIYTWHAQTLTGVGLDLLGSRVHGIGSTARRGFTRMIALGTGGQFGTAQESALKMLEMTDGRVAATAESWLGFRHGPMCALREDCLLLLFFSREAVKRAYQFDVLREIRAKRLPGIVVAVGEGIPAELVSDGDLVVDPPGLADPPDEWAALAQVVVGQLLGFFRCVEEGLDPDNPAGSGSISRVVPPFRI